MISMSKVDVIKMSKVSLLDVTMYLIFLKINVLKKQNIIFRYLFTVSQGL